MFKFGCNSIKQTDAFSVLSLNPHLTETDNVFFYSLDGQIQLFLENVIQCVTSASQKGSDIGVVLWLSSLKMNLKHQSDFQLSIVVWYSDDGEYLNGPLIVNSIWLGGSICRIIYSMYNFWWIYIASCTPKQTHYNKFSHLPQHKMTYDHWMN